jgi:voltage-gated potassium channel
MASQAAAPGGFRASLFRIIFEADTPAGKVFDVALIGVIVLSVLAAMLESVPDIGARHGELLRAVEWGITLLFTLEYVLRLWCVVRPWRYAVSFFGVVDLLAILPTYVSVLLPGTQSLVVIRALRLLRIMRVFKLAGFLGEANLLLDALRNSSRKILVFLSTVVILNLILGSVMYLVEGRASGFDSIPRAVYWAIVTMTTVGYGDIAPVTVPGQIVAAGVMILGYSIIAVPTGLVTAEMFSALRPPVTARSCPYCLTEGHERSAAYCKHCGEALPGAPSVAGRRADAASDRAPGTGGAT